MRLRRLPRRVAVTAAVLLAATLSAVADRPARAQGFFEQLFGGFSKPAPQPNAGHTTTPGGRAYPPSGGFSPWGAPVHRFPDDDSQRDHGRKYRTVCVRLCDGYYFPISFATGRDGFSADSNKCRSSCGTEARLYYYRADGGSTETMEDLAGRPYAQMPNAFRYRKTFVSGCQCKPDPWTDAELARHRNYAEAEARRNPRLADATGGMPLPRTVAAARRDMAQERVAALAQTPDASPPIDTAAPVATDNTAAAGLLAVPPLARKTKRGRTQVADAGAVAGAVPAGPTPRARTRTASRTQRPTAATKASWSNGGSGWGLTQQPKYAWPGDAARR